MSTNVSLPPETEAYAKSLIASGFYSSMSEVVREALRLHRKYEQLYLKELHEELKLAADQVDKGETEPHDMQGIIDEVHAEKTRRKK